MSNDPRYRIIKAHFTTPLKAKRKEILEWLQNLEATKTKHPSNLQETKNYWLGKLQQVNESIKSQGNREQKRSIEILKQK